jgi:hypothetical protein
VFSVYLEFQTIHKVHKANDFERRPMLQNDKDNIRIVQRIAVGHVMALMTSVIVGSGRNLGHSKLD